MENLFHQTSLWSGVLRVDDRVCSRWKGSAPSLQPALQLVSLWMSQDPHSVLKSTTRRQVAGVGTKTHCAHSNRALLTATQNRNVFVEGLSWEATKVAESGDGSRFFCHRPPIGESAWTGPVENTSRQWPIGAFFHRGSGKVPEAPREVVRHCQCLGACGPTKIAGRQLCIETRKSSLRRSSR